MFGFLIGTLLSLIVFTTLLSVSENIPILNIAPSIGSLAIGISAIVAIFLYMATIKRHESEDARKNSSEYLKEAINILERVYDIFTDNGENLSPPRNNRILWLTTARIFLRYYRIRNKINQSDHQEIIKEHEEYWRSQFYNILNNNRENFTLEYFQQTGEPGNPVHRDSIGVIFDFAKWYDDTEDPLKEADVITMHAKGAVPLDQFGVEEFLEQYPDYIAKIAARRQELSNEQ